MKFSWATSPRQSLWQGMQQGGKRIANNCSPLSGIVTVGRSSRRNGEESWGFRPGIWAAPVLSGAGFCCMWCGAAERWRGASTPSAFLYATMTVLSRAVSPHQQPSILIAQPKSQSKLRPPHPHHNQSNQRTQRAKKTNLQPSSFKSTSEYYVSA